MGSPHIWGIILQVVCYTAFGLFIIGLGVVLRDGDY